jgi:hypothetical protein
MTEENIIRESKDEAWRLFREKKYDEARLMLEKRIMQGSRDPETFKLLIDIFRKKDDYANLIRTIGLAASVSSKKKGFRELKKVCILERMLKDIKKCET